LRASEYNTVQSATVIIKDSDFIVSLAIFKDINVQGTNLSVGSSQSTGSRNGERVRSKSKDTLARAKIFKDNVGVKIAWSTISRTAVITVMGHLFYLRDILFFENSFV
jgi:hypothetical protein